MNKIIEKIVSWYLRIPRPKPEDIGVKPEDNKAKAGKSDGKSWFRRNKTWVAIIGGSLGLIILVTCIIILVVNGTYNTTGNPWKMAMWGFLGLLTIASVVTALILSAFGTWLNKKNQATEKDIDRIKEEKTRNRSIAKNAIRGAWFATGLATICVIGLIFLGGASLSFLGEIGSYWSYILILIAVGAGFWAIVKYYVKKDPAKLSTAGKHVGFAILVTGLVWVFWYALGSIHGMSPELVTSLGMWFLAGIFGATILTSALWPKSKLIGTAMLLMITFAGCQHLGKERTRTIASVTPRVLTVMERSWVIEWPTQRKNKTLDTASGPKQWPVTIKAYEPDKLVEFTATIRNGWGDPIFVRFWWDKIRHPEYGFWEQANPIRQGRWKFDQTSSVRFDGVFFDEGREDQTWSFKLFAVQTARR